MLEQLILISSALVGFGDGTIELPLSVATEKVYAQLSAYCAKEGIQYDSRVVPIFGSLGEVIGFQTELNGEDLAFDLAGYFIDASSVTGVTNYFSSALAGMTPLSDLISANNFSVSSCVCQIPSLVSIYGSSSFGNWNAVSFDCVVDDCAQIASMDLIYTYRFTGGINPSVYSTASTLYPALQASQNYQPGLGITLSDFLPGLNAVLSTGYSATNGTFDATKPVICAYSPASGSLGHFAMKIGEAETTIFWLIKNKWDIVVSSTGNYSGVEPIAIDHAEEGCFFGIESSRRQATFVLFGC